MSHKRVQVTFTKAQWNMIKRLKGEMGSSDSDVVRTIILAWLAEKSFISTQVKKKRSKSE